VKLHVHWRSVVTGSSGRGDNEPTPVVEPKPGETAPPATSRALDKRIRQQEILAQIGVMALQGSGFERLLAETVRLTADGTEADSARFLSLSLARTAFWCGRVSAGILASSERQRSAPISNRPRASRCAQGSR
jgi:hypothetical protein